jgi:hypothetical protein
MALASSSSFGHQVTAALGPTAETADEHPTQGPGGTPTHATELPHTMRHIKQVEHQGEQLTGVKSLKYTGRSGPGMRQPAEDPEQ